MKLEHFIVIFSQISVELLVIVNGLRKNVIPVDVTYFVDRISVVDAQHTQTPVLASDFYSTNGAVKERGNPLVKIQN